MPTAPCSELQEPAAQEPVAVEAPKTPLLDNSLEPPQLRLHTPVAPPAPTISTPMTGAYTSGGVPRPTELPSGFKSPRASYRECPFCGAPLKEGSDLCEICGGRYDGLVGLSREPIAGPWQRLLARTLDYSIEYFLVVLLLVLLVFALAFASRQLGGVLISEEKLGIFMMFFLGGSLRSAFLFAPFVFLLDSLEYALFGNTLGKWLFGVKVFDVDARPLTASAYFIRNMRVYWGGYGLNFPIVSIFTMYTQYKFVSQGLSTTYDNRLSYVSVSHNESIVKTVLGVLLLCILPLITAAIVLSLRY